MFRLTFLLVLASVALVAAATTRNGKIVGGQKAVEGQFPYMVSLRPSHTPRTHGCGGFIINSR